ncbi:TetR/AcrR family transcriptional regulator [Micromonospora sp. PSH03]|uniref:TetR/AcrR family transcriptional regulator n=1 Tax=Micromonospora salmantinae TaxID=2911211 RepID=UPI001EE97BF7|nr:TetR/AcrR family transcriptional regulator [Micromonospora salmantinae]MCG5455548.1 TetR/AcrR family transcriptional regulator [Micromonospora salmantinae]
MRALTHRAVDGRAGMPPGTTSAYLRTRQALIEAVVGLPPRLDGGDLDALAAGVAEVLDRWLSTGRSRSLARYACLLEAVHRPELRGILQHGTGLRVQARDLLTRAGAADPDRQGDQFVAFVDGLLFDRLAGAGALSAPQPGTAASRADLSLTARGHVELGRGAAR